MSWLHAARARLRLLVSRPAVEARMEQEIGFHLDMEAERLVREEGLPPDEARRRARVAFGGVERHKEELRAGRGLAWLGGLSLDLKLGVRMLAKSPGLTLVGVLGLAVAVTIGSVSWAIIYSFIGTTVPIDEGERVVVIQNTDARRGWDVAETHLHDLANWREALPAVAELAAFRTVDRNVISRGTSPDPMRIAEMTASGFRIARVSPLLGRYLHDEDERPGAPPVVVIGHDVWRHRFGSAPDIVGQPLQIGATEHTIVGVMPEGFAFPVNNRIWTALRLEATAFARGEAPPVQVFGRLARGFRMDDAKAQAATIARRLAAAHPRSHEHVRTTVMPYTLAFFDSPELAWALHLLQLLVSMLLVVIGTNVAVLVYARTASRAGEIAVRTALGASRARVVVQLFAEALVLSSLAAAVGLGGASYALWHLRAWAKRTAGEQVPYWMDFGLTPGLLLYVAGLAVVAAVIVGVVPALKATRRDVLGELQQLGTGGSALRLGRTWSVLIVSQVAIAVTLLPAVLYVLLARQGSPVLAMRTFPTHEFVTAGVFLDRDATGPRPAGSDSAFAVRHALLTRELVRRLEADVRVADVVFAANAPGSEQRVRMEMEGGRTRTDSTDDARAAPWVAVNQVTLDYFQALEIPLLAGRLLGAADATPEATAVVVNESFVQRFLGGGDVLGRRVRRAASAEEEEAAAATDVPWLEIVGVVADFPRPADQGSLQPRLFEPLLPGATAADARRSVVRRLVSATQPTSGELTQPVTMLVRVKTRSPAAFGPRLLDVAVATDPMLRLEGIAPLDDLLALDMADRMIFVAVVLVALSVVALSAAGIYALVAFTIVRRRREIGIRAALGAGPRRVLVSVLSAVARQVATGIVVGLALGALVLKSLEGGGWDARGGLALLAVAALMSAIGVAAALGPARGALRIQPTEALRAQ